MTKQDAAYEGWAVVEIAGHNVIVGYVSERVQYGKPMLQVDVPEIEVGGIMKPAWTKFVGGEFLFGVTPTTEEIAREAARRLDVRPVSLWTVPNPKPALPAGDLGQIEPDEYPEDYSEDDEDDDEPRF